MITGGRVGHQKGNELREQTGNYCNYYYKLKERNMIVKLFMQTIETE